MNLKLHFISIFLLVAPLLNQSVYADLLQRMTSNQEYTSDNVHQNQLTNQTLKQHLLKRNSLTDLPDELLEEISSNLDFKSNVKLGTTSMLLKIITKKRNAKSKNLDILNKTCGKSVYWSLIQNGYSIFLSKYADRWRSIEQHERCIRAIILNHETVKSQLKHFSIVYPNGGSSINGTLTYYNALEALFNITDHFESITIQSENAYQFANSNLESQFLRMISRLNVDSVIFETRVRNDDAFGQFVRESSLKYLTITNTNYFQTSQLQYLSNLESLTLLDFPHPQIDFSRLTHLRHIRACHTFMNFDTIFAGMNELTSIHATPINYGLESILKQTTKQLTSLTFYHRIENNEQERINSFNFLTKFIATLKHITIVANSPESGFRDFLEETTVLESITVQSSLPMHFLEHAHGIKYFEFQPFTLTAEANESLIQFIKRQTKLELLSIVSIEREEKYASLFLVLLDEIIAAILVMKTVKTLNLNVELSTQYYQSKSHFITSFLKSISKLKSLDLHLNGIPIKNVVRDLEDVNEIELQTIYPTLHRFKLYYRETPTLY